MPDTWSPVLRWPRTGKAAGWDPKREGSDLLKQRARGRISEEQEYWAASEVPAKDLIPWAGTFPDTPSLSPQAALSSCCSLIAETGPQGTPGNSTSFSHWVGGENSVWSSRWGYIARWGHKLASASEVWLLPSHHWSISALGVSSSQFMLVWGSWVCSWALTLEPSSSTLFPQWPCSNYIYPFPISYSTEFSPSKENI